MKKVVVAILLIWAIIATAIAFQQYQEIQKLEKEKVSLEWQAHSNKTTSEKLMREKTELEKTIDELKRENENLIVQLHDLKIENENLREQVMELRVKVSQLEDRLKLYEQVPHGYYSTNFFLEYRNTVEDLKTFLSKLKLPHKYERGVFDCSEISAYVEWALEDAGFDAYIVLAEDHAWNMVKVAGATYYVDMSSGKPYIFKSDKRYPKIVKIFKNIYEAVEYYHSVKEWDWWNVVDYPPKEVLA